MTGIAFLSCAHIHARGFLRSVAQIPGARVAAIWDDVPARARRHAQDLDAPVVDELDAVLVAGDVDAFVIAAENNAHLPLLERVLPLGKPVLCEKPLGTTVADARRIAELLDRHRTPLCSGYVYPFRGAMRAVVGMLRDGGLGRVLRGSFRNCHHGAFARWFDDEDLAWFRQPERSGGGALLDEGTHALHQLLWLLGPVRRVWAHAAVQGGAYPATDDFGIMHLDFVSGAWGGVEGSWTQIGGPKGLELVGDAGTLWERDGGVVVDRGQRGGRGALDPLEDRPSLVDRLVQRCRGAHDPEEERRDTAAALHATLVMACAYDAARRGTWVDVPELPGEAARLEPIA